MRPGGTVPPGAKVQPGPVRMKMKASSFVLAALAAASLALSPRASHAQVFTPTYMAPRASNDVGIYYADIGDFGLEGILRRHYVGNDLGLRVGVIGGDNSALMVGGELRSPLSLQTAPLDLALTAGIQAIFGDYDRIGFQGGLSIGHTFVTPGVTLTPYIHPRLAFTDDVNNNLKADVRADVGVDFALAPNLTIRLGVPLESHHTADFGIGLAWRQ